MSSSERFANSIEGGFASSGIPLLEVIWRRKLLIAFFVVLGLGCGYWYYMEAPRVYQSSAVILVKERQAAPITSTNLELAPSDKMETQLQVIASRAVLSRAAEILTNPIQNEAEIPSSADSDSPVDAGPSAASTEANEGKAVTPAANPAPELSAANTNTDANPRAELSRFRPVKVDARLPDRLASGLQASILRNSETISVSFRSSDPELATRSLESVLKAYDEKLRSTYQDIGEETAKLIKKASDNLRNELSEKRKAYEAFRNDAGKKDKFLMIDGQLANMHSKRLGDLFTQVGQLESKLHTIETELKQIEEIGSKMPVDQSAALAILSKLNEMTGGALLQQKVSSTLNVERSTTEIARLTDLLLTERELSARFGEEHPKIQDSRDKIKLLSELLDKLEEEKKLAAQARATGMEEEKANAIQLPRSPEEWVSTYAGILRHDRDLAKAERDVISAAIDEVQKLAQDLDLLIVQDTNLRAEIKQAEELSSQILTRLDEIDIVKQSGGTRAVILNPPSFARQVAPSLFQMLAISGVLGCLLGIGIGYLLEQGKGTFRSPVDITRNLELPILGQVPAIEARRVKRAMQLASVPQTIISAHQPSSSISESFRAIRTALYFSGEGKDSQVIQVTSPTPGDGKSTVISNLAVSIAKSGRKVLLIDADLRRPTLHRIFGVENTVALGSYLASETESQLEPLATLIPDLSILPSGPSVSNPSELLSSAKLAELIKSLRLVYDFVLIDTPPVLAVTDPLTVAARVDGVIMAIRIANGVQFSSKRAKEALDRVGANILGVVVNGFAPNSTFARGLAKDYGYSANYGYGYRTGYGYSRSPYSEPYSDRANRSESGHPAAASLGK